MNIENKKTSKQSRSIKAEKRGGNNLEKNFKKGSRRKIIALLLYSGIIDFKNNELINEQHRSFLTQIGNLKKEGLIEKRSSAYGSLYSFSTFNHKIKDVAFDFFNADLLEYYDAHGKQLATTAKRTTQSKAKAIECENESSYPFSAEQERAFLFSQAIMFLDGTKIEYIPGGYEYANYCGKEPLDNTEKLFNSFYSIYELIDNAGNRFRFTASDISDNRVENKKQSFSSSRALGLVVIGKESYVLYNFGSSTRQIFNGPELRLKKHINDVLLPQHRMDSLSGQIVLYKNDSVIKDIMFAPKESRDHRYYENLAYGCRHIYFIPLNHIGKRLLVIMQANDWVSVMRTLSSSFLNLSNLNHTDTAEKPSDTKFIECDSITSIKLSNRQVISRYTLYFTVPDVERLKNFISSVVFAIKSEDQKEEKARMKNEIYNKERMSDKFLLVCFDYMRPFIEPLMKKYGFDVFYINFDKLFERFFDKIEPSAKNLIILPKPKKGLNANED